MEKRYYNMNDMYAENERYTTISKNSIRNYTQERCLNTDFCVPSPENMNNGILTMAFVDMQPIETVYQPQTALMRGTLFPNIDKPFCPIGGHIK